MEVANQGKSVGILSAAPKSAGLQLGGSGNPDFLIAADTTNNQLESMAQIHGSTSANGQGELTLSTQGLDSSGNVARGNINLIADSLKLNGKTVHLNNLIIGSGSLVINVGGGNSAPLFNTTQIKNWHGIEYLTGNTVIIVNNGDGYANGAHVEGVTYFNNGEIWVLFDRNFSGLIRVNYMVLHNG